MKIKLLTSLSGPAGAFVPGDVIEVDEAEGTRFLDRGLAESVADIPAQPAAPVEGEAVATEPKRRKRT
jgi:hypothetical protein